jgi:hypothetical protein
MWLTDKPDQEILQWLNTIENVDWEFLDTQVVLIFEDEADAVAFRLIL